MITVVRHFGISVTNMEKSLKFYRDLLGLKIVREMNESGKYIDNMLGIENVRVKTVKLSANDGTLVELLEFKSHKGDDSQRNIFDIGASHLAFTVDNLDMCYRDFSKNGVVFNAPPQLSPDGCVKVTFCSDPDGTPVELVEELHST